MNPVNTFNNYLKNKYNERLWRLPLSTGYPCPNRINDKTGCTFCNGKSFLPHYLLDNDTLENQIERGTKFFSKRYKVDFFYGYFQFNTSTYGPIDDLLGKYERVLSRENIKGLIISTRPDYVDKRVISEIMKLNERIKKDIWIELGLQSVYNKTLLRINRNHTYEDFKTSCRIIKENSDFKITVHYIIGLPGETPEMITEGIKILFRENSIDGIKFRLLEILPDTPMIDDFKKHPHQFYKFNIDSYLKLLCDILEYIPQSTVVMRLVNYKTLQILNNDSGKKTSKLELLNLINKELENRNIKTGS